MHVIRHSTGAVELDNGEDSRAEYVPTATRPAPTVAEVVPLPVVTKSIAPSARPLPTLIAELEQRLAVIELAIAERKSLENERKQIKRLLKAATRITP